MKANDVLQIGPYKYTVVSVVGKWATVRFITTTGEEREVCLKVKQ
jgi:hypothetical protein